MRYRYENSPMAYAPNAEVMERDSAVPADASAASEAAHPPAFA